MNKQKYYESIEREAAAHRAKDAQEWMPLTMIDVSPEALVFMDKAENVLTLLTTLLRPVDVARIERLENTVQLLLDTLTAPTPTPTPIPTTAPMPILTPAPTTAPTTALKRRNAWTAHELAVMKAELQAPVVNADYARVAAMLGRTPAMIHSKYFRMKNKGDM